MRASVLVLVVSTSLIACSPVARPGPSKGSSVVASALGTDASGVKGQCQQHGYGCGSCVADGVWGALWVNSDCSRRCDKVCGNGPATANAALYAQKIEWGPHLVASVADSDKDSKDAVESMGTGGAKPSKGSTKVGAASGTAATAIADSSDSAWCGVFGPSSDSITCGTPLVAHCWCDPGVFGAWGIAKCECQGPPDPPPQQPPTTNCSIPSHDYPGCGPAGVGSYWDPGCATNCVSGYHGVCQWELCTGNTWVHDFCGCAPGA
jgi:hypothetical protein